MELNKIADNEGATKNRMRVGRGVGSGKGKTAGRGVKGQKSRGGVSINGFEGGQMPIHMRMPKRGFAPPNTETYAWTNLYRLQKAIDAGRLDAKKPVDVAALVAAGLIRREKDGVRLLAQGAIKAKINITVTGASAAAIDAIKAAGGSVTVLKPRASAETSA
jgi:large subunit ribosomal protein L15